jgi:hypothetical protein
MKTEKLLPNMMQVHDANTMEKTMAASEKSTIRITIPKENKGMM